MPRPQSKPELLDAANATYDKLLALIEQLSPVQREATFTFDDRDRNVRDVVVHLHEWHLLLLSWVESNTHGTPAPFLPEGYTFQSYAGLNEAFRDQHAATSLDAALQSLEESFARVHQVIASLSNEELFTKRYYTWTGTTSLGAYCISATSSHNEWAMKKIRRHARG